MPFSEKQVIEQHCAYFITAHKFKFAVSVVYCNSYSVAVRVGGKKNVCVVALCNFKRKFECLPDFRVRIRAGGEIAVRIFLLRYNINIFYTYSAEDTAHGLVACSVKRCVNNF